MHSRTHFFSSSLLDWRVMACFMYVMSLPTIQAEQIVSPKSNNSRESNVTQTMLLTEPASLRAGQPTRVEFLSDQPETEGTHNLLRCSLTIQRRKRGGMSLCLVQEDVKAEWLVWLNEKEIGRLLRNENRIELCFSIPPKRLKPKGTNFVLPPENPRWMIFVLDLSL